MEPTDAQIRELADWIKTIPLDELTIDLAAHKRGETRLSYDDAKRFSSIIIDRWERMKTESTTPSSAEGR